MPQRKIVQKITEKDLENLVGNFACLSRGLKLWRGTLEKKDYGYIIYNKKYGKGVYLKSGDKPTFNSTKYEIILSEN